MAIVTSDFLSALFTSYSVVWEQAFLAAQNQQNFERYCTTVPSTTDTESYNWLGNVPAMKQWTDTRDIQGMSAYNYSLKNLHYEVTIGVDRDTLEDDKYNLIQPRIQQLGLEAARFPANQAITALVDGGSTGNNSYDGVTYFSASHVEDGSGLQSNTNTGSGVSLANIRTDLLAARTKMRRMKDNKGRPMNIIPDLVIIPPDLQDVFEQLITTNLVAGAGVAGTLVGQVAMSNNLMGAVDIYVNAYLTDTSDWFLMATKYPMKPLIYQLRKAPEFNAVTDPNDFVVFNQRQFYYGVDSRFAVGYGMWQTCQRVTN